MSRKLCVLLSFNLAVGLGSAAQHGLFGSAEWVVPDECNSLVRYHRTVTKQFYYKVPTIVGWSSPVIEDQEPVYGSMKVWSPRFLRPVVLKGKVVPVKDKIGQFSSVKLF